MPRYDDSTFSPAAPVAQVNLRSPDGSALVTNVPLLIDTGADVTLLPQASVDLLGMRPKRAKSTNWRGSTEAPAYRGQCVLT